MEEKYVAVLFEKINFDLENGLCFFVPFEVLTDCQIDLEDDILVSKTDRAYLPMDDEEVLFSEDRFCYGYPMSLDALKGMYRDIDGEQERISKYFDELNKTVFFGKHNAEEGKIDLILTNKDVLVNSEDEEWLSEYVVDSNNKEFINIAFDKSVLTEINEVLEKQSNEKLKKLFKEIADFYEDMETWAHANRPIGTDIVLDKKVENNEVCNIDMALDKLNDLIGLENVKKEVNRLVKYLSFISKVKDKTDLPHPNFHMFFTGNPGTGKTTVARIISEILYNLGYVKRNNLVEITTKDLIGEYIGQTAVKTGELLRENKGSVIFIDEAYSFASEAQEYGQEALVEIIKEMEKNESIFIFAGYKDEMKHFMEMNPGLASRVGYYIDYKDYSTEELYQIFKGKVTKSKMKIKEGEADKKILSIIDKAKKQKHFGNGRFIDKLFNKILLQHSINTDNIKNISRLLTITDKDISDDIEKELLYNIESKQTIGFSTNNEKVKKLGVKK